MSSQSQDRATSEPEATESQNLLLIGARGCGKSSVGAALAAATDRRFVDLDNLTLAEFDDASVHEVWRRYGEAGWRRAEVRVLDRVLEDRRQVVAMGGGTPMIDAARQMIAQAKRSGRALTVYLKCSSEVLAARLADAPGDRPSLTGRPIDVEIASVLADREQTYTRLADVVCPADEGSVAEVVDRLQRLLT